MATILEPITQIAQVSSAISNDFSTYIIFISLVFLLCFLFLGLQLLNIFKSLLHKVVEDISKELADIKSKIEKLEDKIA